MYFCSAGGAFFARYALKAAAVLVQAGLRSAAVRARRVVYTPFRSLLDKRHRRLATQARSNRPHTLGLSNVQTQGQVNLPLRLPT